MKNKAEDSIFRKKGFFVALYSSLGAVAVLALVITFASRGTDPYDQDAAPVGADDVLPYQQQAQADEEAWFRPRPTPTPPPMPTPEPRPPAPPRPSVPTEQEHMTPEVPVSTPPPNIMPVRPPEPPPEPEAAAPPPPLVVVPTFVPFNENDRMIWPVLGEIALDFSPNVLSYHPTFGRFQTNESLLISSQEGTPVRAGADGRVTATGHSVDWGNYVLVDHGNGWVARYGQLMDAAMVNVGEIVRTGQVIGGVGQPSYFGTGLGVHFNFHLTRDGYVMNPHHVLAER